MENGGDDVAPATRQRDAVGDDEYRWSEATNYRIVRRIGAGGMGAVYEAIDRRTGQHVALKTVLEFDSAALYGFKQEFRTLADVRHRNLVRLHELVVSEAAPVFFTMELVAGTDFLHYLRADAGAGTEATSSDDGQTVRARGRVADRGRSREHAAEASATEVNYDKLLPVLRQLVDGLRVLHDAGKLHRDIKPSNVLVTPEGRVVLLDFGVATDLHRIGGSEIAPEEDTVVGTPKYMSPEQAAGQAISAASDLYSVGVMVYEVLVGRSPFEGSAIDVITRKASLLPLAPAECVQGIPRALNDLCMALLRIEPEARPSSSEVLRDLGSGRERSSPPKVIQDALLGREVELRALREAYDDARSGQAITVRVSGEAGMGKSQLVRSFLEQLLADGQTNVLSGRAYERESMPYKAVDGVIDSLSQLLVQLDEDLGDYAPPRKLQALARLFPVLGRVSSVDKSGESVDESPQAERRRAFRELRDCLGSLARRRPLVVFIDDVHCGDADSVALLLEVMRRPRAPPILLVMTAREESADGSPFLTAMAAAWPSEIREVRVNPLPAAEALALARSFLDGVVPNVDRVAHAIVSESRGSPLLVQELARSHRRDRGAEGTTAVAGSLESMLARRLAALRPPARHLAEVLAVAGRPLPVATLAAAAGIESDIPETFAALEAAGLARLGFRSERETAEPVHDRLREGVLAQVSASAMEEYHGRLAEALGATPDFDSEALAIHLFGAGKTAEGASCAERAAVDASSKLAFDLSVRLLRMALEATTPGTPRAQQLRVRLAQTLVRAGRASEGADEYAKAAKVATDMERVELERAAAEQLLISGRMDEGQTALRKVMDTMGLSVPRTAIGAVMLLIFYQVRLRMAAVRITERESEDVSREDRIHIDTLRAVATGLSAIDVIMGACMQAKYMLVAMKRGDKVDVLRGFCAQVIQRAIVGLPERPREKRMLEAAEALAARMGSEVQAYIVQTHGLSLYMRGHFRDALEKLDDVGGGLPGVWSTTNSRLFALFACIFLGRHREVARRAPRLLRDVEERGDRYTVVSLRATSMVDAALARDEPEEARRHLREAMSVWTQSGFHAQHWYAMWSEVLVDLYAGDAAAAYARLERDARPLRRSFLLRAQLVRGLTAYLRGCSAVASIAAEPGARAARVAEAHRLAAQLSRQTAAWASTFSMVVRAAAENAAGDRATALSSLRDALRHAEAAHMWPQAWAARYQLGRALGGEEGRAFREQAEQSMRDEGIRSPERTCSVLVPGHWG